MSRGPNPRDLYPSFSARLVSDPRPAGTTYARFLSTNVDRSVIEDETISRRVVVTDGHVEYVEGERCQDGG